MSDSPTIGKLEAMLARMEAPRQPLRAETAAQNPWMRVGDGRYAIEWSNPGPNAGLVGDRVYEALRRDGPVQLAALRPLIAVQVAEGETACSEDTIRLGETRLSINDAKALRTALTLAIDYAERSLRAERRIGAPLVKAVHIEPGTDRS